VLLPFISIEFVEIELVRIAEDTATVRVIAEGAYYFVHGRDGPRHFPAQAPV